jgi:hypothetical protein
LFACLVSDRNIDKNALFTFEVVFQFLGLLFYQAYFWWSVTRKEAT